MIWASIYQKDFQDIICLRSCRSSRSCFIRLTLELKFKAKCRALIIICVCAIFITKCVVKIKELLGNFLYYKVIIGGPKLGSFGTRP